MPNPFEAFWNILKNSIDPDQETPLHVGEVMVCWTYYTALKEMLRFEEAGLNTTKDSEVVEMLKDAYKMCQGQSERLEKLLIKEGVPLPDTSPALPKSSPDDIPLGVKMSDDELANGIGVKIAGSLVECATGQAQSIRNDVGMMWAEFQAELLVFSATLRALKKRRGWLKIPPYFQPPGNKQ
ncbi:DUF3231 family protein [Halalkalibacter alkalisediminis]|uniref:DUF3231 family protein n=1 Tax=Halalkalibacter alkalisediminis TaxID=935616 RepID=A0ABV6NF19_9BACI|nr:DUF3231 family protein [Halalkalibacter alkalisediminis]